MLATILTGAAIVMAADCPAVTGEPADDGSILRIQQPAAPPVTAFLVEIVDYPGNHFAYRNDELVRPSPSEGNAKRVFVPTLMPGTVPEYLKVTAAIFADGSTCGPANKVGELLSARRETLKLTRELLQRLEKQIAKEELAAQLRTWARSQPRAYADLITRTADQLGRGAVAEVLDALRKQQQVLATSKPALF